MAQKQNHGETVQKETATISENQRARLKHLFPEVFTEGKVDWDKLRATLGDIVDDGPERYTFSWAGKRDAIRLLQTPTRATLVPCREESVNFDETQHLFIEGDNLEVLKLLYKPYFGRVKMIYIDPPYNTGNDFIYPDNYADPLATYLKITGQQDAEGNLLTSNPETSGRFHSAWLSMMYPRLFLARQLLREDGVIFVSIDKREEANLRLLMNEVFGEENFISSICVVSNWKGRSDDKYIATAHEQLLAYHRGSFETLGLPLPKEYLNEYLERDEGGQPIRLLGLRKRGSSSRREDRPSMFYPFYVNPKTSTVSLSKTSSHYIAVWPKLSNGSDGCWRWGEKIAKQKVAELVARKVSGTERWDIFQIDYAYIDGKLRRIKPKSVWMDKTYSNDAGTLAYKQLLEKVPFKNPKPPNLIKQCLIQSTSESDIVLDFFAGSCPTAQAVLELNREDCANRRLIMVQIQEPTGNLLFPTIADIGKERIRRVIARMKKEKDEQLPLETRETPEDLGFKVFKLTSSNYRPWRGVDEKKPDAYTEQMESFRDPLVDGWSVENVIYEVALKEGYGLTCRIEPIPGIAKSTVYRVTDPDKEQFFYICLDDSINLQNLSPLNLGKDDLFICRDVALDDEAAANLALQCRLKTI